MSRVKFMFSAICLFALCSCSLTEPFVDRRREAGTHDPQKMFVGKSKPEAPAICYNGFVSQFEDLQKLADAECKKTDPDSKAVFDHEEKFSCRLLLPAHAYFKCEK